MGKGNTLELQERRKAMEKILKEMQVKMQEIEGIRKEIEREQNSGTIRPSDLLEEIKIPKIEIIKEHKEKKN